LLARARRDRFPSPHFCVVLCRARSHPPGLVLEWAQHGSLLSCLREATLRNTAGTQREIGAQVAAALAYLHALGVVHRDLASRNVLVMRLDAILVKVADFGSQLRLLAAVEARAAPPPPIPLVPAFLLF
jgi:serine/threonine protein kinase